MGQAFDFANAPRFWCHPTASLQLSSVMFFGKSGDFASAFASQLCLERNSSLETSGPYSFFAGASVHVHEGATLSLGGGGFMNLESRVACYSKIEIGENTFIGEQVMLRDSDNHIVNHSGYMMTAPISIGSHVWIGSRSTILKGVTIGDGAIVAAGSVVVRNVPAASLVGGVPARVLRENVKWE
ncbi:MAG: acyltransferase [Tepidisphaeraceae bacterium]